MRRLVSFFLFVLCLGALHSEWILDEGFEGGSIPANWTVNDHDGDGSTWFALQRASYAHSGNWIAFAENYLPNQNEDWLITPQLQISQGDSLHFYARSWYSTEDIWVYVSTSNTNVSSFNNELLEVIGLGRNYQNFILDLSSYAGQSIYIAIYWECDTYGIIVDDIKVGQETVAQPDSPGNVTIQYLDSVMQLTWGSTGVNATYRVIAADTPTGEYQDFPGNTTSLTGLIVPLTENRRFYKVISIE
jgi:hypothetical protein